MPLLGFNSDQYSFKHIEMAVPLSMGFQALDLAFVPASARIVAVGRGADGQGALAACSISAGGDLELAAVARAPRGISGVRSVVSFATRE